MEKLFNKSSGSEVFDLFLGRIMCLPEVDVDGVRAPETPFSILCKKKKEKKMYIMKMSLRIQERISWPGFISK